MGLHFDQPLWLLLLLAAFPLGWLGLRWFHAMSRLRAWTSILARALLLALIAMMLAGAATVRQTDRLAVIALVDVSESVRRFAPSGDITGSAAETIAEWLRRAGQGRGPGDLLGVVAFDGEAMAVMTPRGGGGDGEGMSPPLDVQIAEGTNIARAIELGAAMFPPDAARRLVLISDGNETSGNALKAAREVAGGAGSMRTPIDVLPLAYRVERETIVEFVDAPPRASSESTVAVRVGLRSTGGGSGELRLFREGRPIDLNGAAEGYGRRVQWEGERHVETIEVKLDDTPIHRFEAFFEPDSRSTDTLADNNRGEAFTVTPGKGAVLLVDAVSGGASQGAGATLAQTLRDADIDVEVQAPEMFPSDLLSLHAYDLILFQNVAAEQVSRAGQVALRDYVTQLGGGFVMIGGPDSFGAGGWNGTPLEEILPVKLDLPEQLIVPSAAIIFVLDSSGSMSSSVLGGMRSQQDIANEGTALAIETLDKEDLVGVIEFSSAYRVVIPLAKNSNPSANADLVRGISSDGGTNMFPAIARAESMLNGVDAKVKHVIVLSDGRSSGSAATGFQLAERMRASDITISTIAVGDRVESAVLEEIAVRGGGTFHRVVDPMVLPRVFVKEVRVVRKPLVRESLFEPVVRPVGSPLTAGMGADWPALGGLVLTQRREEPAITYAAMAPSGEPLLAHWNVGLGRVAAFTSDAHDWAQRWLGWPGYQRLWTQMARTLARPASSNRYDLITEVTDEGVRVRLEAFDDDGGPLDLLSIPGKVYVPGRDEPVEIRLSQTGPGVYEGSLDSEQTGTYIVALTPRSGARQLAPVIGGATRMRGAEYRRLSSDVGALRRIAEDTGGRLLDLDAPETAQLFDRSQISPSVAVSPIWRTLMAWTLVIFLLDVATRRVAWDRLLDRSVREELRRHAAAATRSRSERAAATASALRGFTGARRAERAGDVDESDVETGRAAARGQTQRAAGDDAAEDARARRQTVRDALQGGPQPRPAEPSAGAEPSTDAAEEAGTASGLLAAKRRARERMARENGEVEDDSEPRG